MARTLCRPGSPTSRFPSRSRLMPAVFAGTPSRDANHNGPNAPTSGGWRRDDDDGEQARIVSDRRWCGAVRVRVVAAAGCCCCRQSVSPNPPAPLSLRRCRSVQLRLFHDGGIRQVAPRRRVEDFSVCRRSFSFRAVFSLRQRIKIVLVA
jgi:hypothetical protein